MKPQSELLGFVHATPSYKLIFNSWLASGKSFMEGDTIHASEHDAYKWIFMNNNVTEKTVQFAISYAIRKVHKLIDNYKA